MPKIVQEYKARPIATFSVRHFAQLIQARGLWYRWSRATVCPCRLNADTDQWDPLCPRCQGDGWYYVNPEAQENRASCCGVTKDYQDVKAVFSTVNDRPTVMEPMGSWPFGEATLTVQNEMRVGFRDRFIGIEQEMAFSQLLIRGSEEKVEIGRYGLSTDAQKKALRYEPVRINFIESDVGGVRTKFFYGTDFTLKRFLPKGPMHLVWLPDKGPAEGDLCTVHYDIRPVWIVDEAIYHVQTTMAPPRGVKGAQTLQTLPTTFKVKLDFLTPQRTTT